MTIFIDKSFPGGNITVEQLGEQELLLNPELRDTEGNWFYWSCRIRGVAGKHLRFRVEIPAQRDYPTLSCLGPAVCSSGGQWHWNPLALNSPTSFEYQFADDENEVCFSNTIPYTESNWRQFLQEYQLQDAELCRSRAGRQVEKLELQRGQGQNQFIITARHHCCETMANFVLEGMLLELLQNWPDFALLMLPFMDKDGCEDGDQGKNRRPYDHNRDYRPEGSIYPSVQALREYVPRWLRPGARLFAFDAHCPMLAGNQYPHWTETANPLLRSRQHRYAQCLQTVQTAGFGFHAATGTPYGVGNNAESRPTACNWFATLPGIEFPFTVETPYALCGSQCGVYDYVTGKPHSVAAPGVSPHGQIVLPESARNWGRDLIRAVQHYLEIP
ncbi:MAG: hypothetical protein WCT05_01295 [Lentisphaeria bacterium]